MDFYIKWSQDPRLEIPGGESFQQVYDRIIPGVSRILDCSQKVILITGHATVNRAIAASLLDIAPQAARSLRIANCGYSKFLVYQYKDLRKIILDSWNIKSHLEV
jgi:broad specificity phosphatase PhoE